MVKEDIFFLGSTVDRVSGHFFGSQVDICCFSARGYPVQDDCTWETTWRDRDNPSFTADAETVDSFAGSKIVVRTEAR